MKFLKKLFKISKKEKIPDLEPKLVTSELVECVNEGEKKKKSKLKKLKNLLTLKKFRKSKKVKLNEELNTELNEFVHKEENVIDFDINVCQNYCKIICFCEATFEEIKEENTPKNDEKKETEASRDEEVTRKWTSYEIFGPLTKREKCVRVLQKIFSKLEGSCDNQLKEIKWLLDKEFGDVKLFN